MLNMSVIVPNLLTLHCLFSSLSSSSQLYIPHPHQEDMDPKTNAKVTHMLTIFGHN